MEFYVSWNPTLLSIFSVSSTFHRFPLTLSPSRIITLRHLYARSLAISPFIICTLALLHSPFIICTLDFHQLFFSASAICFSWLLLFEPFQILCKYKYFLNRFKVFFDFFASRVLRHRQNLPRKGMIFQTPATSQSDQNQERQSYRLRWLGADLPPSVLEGGAREAGGPGPPRVIPRRDVVNQPQLHPVGSFAERHPANSPHGDFSQQNP